MTDVSHVTTEDLWAALAASQEAFIEISQTLSSALEMKELGDQKLTAAEAVVFRARHWQTLWDSNLSALKTAESMPERFRELLKL